MEFSSLPLNADILAVVEELGFKSPTPIQAEGIPVLLNGQDLIGQSKTGSGKTAAYALPILQNIILKQRTIQALVLCPTRELSVQVAKEFRKLGRRLAELQVVPLYGGIPSREQVQALQSGPQIVVGTPGRILDLGTRGKLFLGDLKFLVIDEADKMLEMGFEDELSALISNIPKQRQTALFSATFPESVKEVSRRYQKKPVEVFIGTDAEVSNPIEQLLYDYNEIDEKASILMRVLQQHPVESTLIFCNQRNTVDELAKMFSDQGVSCGALHGEFDQRERDRVVALFRNKSYRILVATDVAARGIDIDHLGLVINFDFPLQPETYVHRIGRTGRAGKSGVAVLLAKPIETLKIMELEKATKGKFARPKLGFKNQHSIGSSHSETLMQTISISGGRKEKLRPGDILGALTNAAVGLTAAEVGKIEITDHLSLVAVSSTKVQEVLKKLRAGKIKGKRFQIRIMGT